VSPGESGGSTTELLGGRYRLGERLGSGGMADVHRATDEGLERDVAVKILGRATGSDTDRARFIAEARILAGLSHTSLVTVLDAGFDTERPYLVMELVDGPNLAQVCAAGPCDERLVASVGVQVAVALAFIHGRGIVHRDVKPANVLLGPDNHVKLADFGIARLIGEDSGYTRTGYAVGTAAYLAPEQVRGEEISGAADVYSLALVLLEAFTGRREYEGVGLEAAAARLSRPPAIPDDLPGAWPALLTAMTDLDPGARPSAAEVASRLRSQPTGPIPPTRELRPDAATVPLLQVPLAAAPVPDRAGDALTRRAREFARRLAAVPAHQRAIAAVVLALVVLVVVAGLVARNQEPQGPDLPADTPADLRGPLADLHDAVYGGG
jgi:eukaryotic-like serine/threonine-protein kinase